MQTKKCRHFDWLALTTTTTGSHECQCQCTDGLSVISGGGGDQQSSTKRTNGHKLVAAQISSINYTIASFNFKFTNQILFPLFSTISAPDRFRRNVDNIQLVTAAGSAAANFNSLNRFAGTVDAEFSRAARSQTLNRWQVIFRKVKNNNNNNNQAVQPKLDSELEGYQTTAQAVTEDVLGEELRNAAAAAVTSALAFRSSSTEVPSEEEEKAMVDAAKKSTEEAKKKASLVKAIRIMKAQKISPDIIYSIVQNYQDDPERLMAILTSNKI